MPKRPRGEKRPADTVGPAKPVTEVAGSKNDQNTPEEDALEKIARAVARKSEAARDASVMAHERAEFARLTEEGWTNS